MRYACLQECKEDVASLETQKRRLRSKVARPMDCVTTTCEFDVCLKVFGDSAAVNEHLKVTMMLSASPERKTGEVADEKDDLIPTPDNNCHSVL